MSEQKPWEVEGNPWQTEAKFITWIRGVLRKGWSRYPLKINFKNSVRYPVKNTNPRSMKRFPMSWMIDCEICKKAFQQNDVEVDHIGDAGSFKTIDDILSYATHLFMLTPDKMRCLCKPCHKIVSHSQRTGTSFEEASLLKDVIKLFKEESTEDITDFILAFSFLQEYNVNNEKERKKAVESIYRFAEEE